MNNRYVYRGITVFLLLLMVAAAIALWQGIISIEWLASLGYKGIFLLSLINGIAPVGGPSQVATFFVASKLNPLAVGLAAGVGGSIGELAGYSFGYSLRGAQTADVERKIQRLANWRFLRISRERSFFPLFILASIPNPFFDPASALAGSLRIGFVQYFIPVLLGKVVRHVAIAYAGYFAISTDIVSALNNTSMITYIDSMWFVVAVLGIALVAWLVRSFAESDPDPLLINFTFFAFAGQCILTGELVREGNPKGVIFGLLLLAAILGLLQILTIRAQADKTLEHYKNLLERNRIGDLSSDEIERWAEVLVRVTGVDFFPEFYMGIFKGLGRGPREKRRRQAVSILPRNQFRCEAGGITTEALTVPPEERKVLWRLYAFICLASWLVFIGCILISSKHP